MPLMKQTSALELILLSELEKLQPTLMCRGRWQVSSLAVCTPHVKAVAGEGGGGFSGF